MNPTFKKWEILNINMNNVHIGEENKMKVKKEHYCYWPALSGWLRGSILFELEYSAIRGMWQLWIFCSQRWFLLYSGRWYFINWWSDIPTEFKTTKMSFSFSGIFLIRSHFWSWHLWWLLELVFEPPILHGCVHRCVLFRIGNGTVSGRSSVWSSLFSAGKKSKQIEKVQVSVCLRFYVN